MKNSEKVTKDTADFSKILQNLEFTDVKFLL